MVSNSRRNIQTVEINKETYERLKNKATAKHYNTKDEVQHLRHRFAPEYQYAFLYSSLI